MPAIRPDRRPRAGVTIFGLLFLLALAAGAAPPSLTVTLPPALESAGFKMGSATQPGGDAITLDTYSLRLNGAPWTPVMGEFHFSRYPETEWREELLKMKAGGVDIVANYVFWIHHEEVEGEWDWTGCRDLRRFNRLCAEVGLKTIIRCGPWCHGEVRNGGHPDWLLQKGWKLRSNDSNYLAQAGVLYGQIAKQLSGQLWKDGGPVIGIQFENEYRGPAAHLLTLKQLGRAAGLDVPLYTRTGWPPLTTPMPFGEVVPLYGVYAEGFWDRELKPMPGHYWAGFHFSTQRTDANIANEVLGRGQRRDPEDVAQYPYLTCEIGGGMMSSYHRRILVNPADIDSTTLVKLGSGSTSPGYYMYHGGVNPEGKLTTLNESQANGEWNDLPVKNYDFQTALGQYGQIRPQYHTLRRLHLFLHEWGATFAGMSVNLPEQRSAGRDDLATLRWAVRSDGERGFVFVNNYQRRENLPGKTNVQFHLKLPGRTISFPSQPVTVPADVRFFWPFNLELAPGVTLAWASAQPITAIDDGDTRIVLFAETPGVKAEFTFPTNAATDLRRLPLSGAVKILRNVKPSRNAALELKTSTGTAVRIVLLNERDSLALWKCDWQGRDRVFLSEAGLVTDGDSLRLTATAPGKLNVGIFPAPESVWQLERKLRSKADGLFTRYAPKSPEPAKLAFHSEQLRPAGPARAVPLGKTSEPVAAQPTDADFATAAVWRIQFPNDLPLNSGPLLRLHYEGDVARVRLNGKLINDDFYNGLPLEIGLRRHAPDILKGELTVAILPLRQDAPIYFPDAVQRRFENNGLEAKLTSVELVPRYQVELGGTPRPER